MVKIGSKVKAQGLGALMVSMVKGSTGTGEVYHVENSACIISHPVVQERFERGDFSREYLNDGILYWDEGAQELLWLARGDYQVI